MTRIATTASIDCLVNKLEWTPERIAAFWDHFSRRPWGKEVYFAHQVGAAVVTFLSYATPLAGRSVLDYGCGPGFLASHLLDRNANVWGMDTSKESVAAANVMLEAEDGWRGAVAKRDGFLPFDEGAFDVVCCLETIEHVLDEDLQRTATEVLRVLRVGGSAIFTTPNDEDLDRHSIFCPACRCEFHNMQHVRRWSARQLRDWLEKVGFGVQFCDSVDFREIGEFCGARVTPWSELSFRKLGRHATLRMKSMLDRLLGKRFPNSLLIRSLVGTNNPAHLVAIATKTTERAQNNANA